jgi:hypothetical protein
MHTVVVAAAAEAVAVADSKKQNRKIETEGALQRLPSVFLLILNIFC